MKRLLAAVLVLALSSGVACSRGGRERPQTMAPCAGCGVECPTDRACPKEGKCARCDAKCDQGRKK